MTGVSRTAAASRRLTMRSVSRQIRCQCSMRKPIFPRTTLMWLVSVDSDQTRRQDIRKLIFQVARDSHLLDTVDPLASGLLLVGDRSMFAPFLERWLRQERLQHWVVFDYRMVTNEW